MKTKLTLALVATLTSTAFASFKAPLPEFKNERQLAEWRAEKASEATSQGYAAEETAFYTGKPYLASSGDYVFKFRSYNPELARWRSEDPSGFPDGANGNIYNNDPLTGLDPDGLRWRTTLINTTDATQHTPAHTTGIASSIDGAGNLIASDHMFIASSNMIGQLMLVFGAAYAEIYGNVTCDNTTGKINVSTKPIDTDASLFTKSYVTTSLTYSGENEVTINFTWGGSILGSVAGGGVSAGGAAIDKSFTSLTYRSVE